MPSRDSGGRSLATAVEHYLKTVSPQKDGSDTLAQETRRLTFMLEHFGRDTKLTDIDSERIGRWRDWRLTGDTHNKPVSGSTVVREANLLRNLFTLAVEEWRWLDRHPFRGVRLPKENPARSVTWPWQLIRRVLRAPRSGKTLQCIQAFHIALHTGMRLNEVLSARLDGKVAVLAKDKANQRTQVRVPLARKGAQLLATFGPFTVGANEASVLFSELCDELLIDGLTFHDSRASALT